MWSHHHPAAWLNWGSHCMREFPHIAHHLLIIKTWIIQHYYWAGHLLLNGLDNVSAKSLSILELLLLLLLDQMAVGWQDHGLASQKKAAPHHEEQLARSAPQAQWQSGWQNGREPSGNRLQAPWRSWHGQHAQQSQQNVCDFPWTHTEKQWTPHV